MDSHSFHLSGHDHPTRNQEVGSLKTLEHRSNQLMSLAWKLNTIIHKKLMTYDSKYSIKIQVKFFYS